MSLPVTSSTWQSTCADCRTNARHTVPTVDHYAGIRMKYAYEGRLEQQYAFKLIHTVILTIYFPRMLMGALSGEFCNFLA